MSLSEFLLYGLQAIRIRKKIQLLITQQQEDEAIHKSIAYVVVYSVKASVGFCMGEEPAKEPFASVTS